MLNAINELLLALGNIVSDFENMDLTTPKQLKLGRNNDKSQVSPIKVVANHLRYFRKTKKSSTYCLKHG